MPAGQTPHTVILFAHNDLVDAVQPGDRWVGFGIVILILMLLSHSVLNITKGQMQKTMQNKTEFISLLNGIY